MSSSPRQADSKHDEVHKRKGLKAHLEFWKDREKFISSGDDARAASPSPPPLHPQTRSISIPNVSTSSPSSEHNNNNSNINAHANLRISNSTSIGASISVNTTSPLINHPSIDQQDLSSSSSTPHASSTYSRIRNTLNNSVGNGTKTIVSKKDYSMITHSHSNTLGMPIAPNGICSSTSNDNADVSSSGSSNSKLSIGKTSSLRSSDPPVSGHVPPRRRSLNERIFYDYGLQERPAKTSGTKDAKSSSDDEITTLLNKIHDSELLLNTMEEQLKEETLKRVDNRYSKALEATLQKGETDRKAGGEAEKQILHELENFKSLQAKYESVLEEVAESKHLLASKLDLLRNSADSLDFNKRMSAKNVSNPAISSEPEPAPKRKTNSFNETISNLKRDISRTSIKILGPLASKRQSHKIDPNHLDHSLELEFSSEVVNEDEEESETTTMHAELFKQLIQQKYANVENIRSPFINNLRTTWRQRVSKSDSWAHKMQAGEWDGPYPDDDVDDDNVLVGSGVSERKRDGAVYSKSQNYIGLREPEDSPVSRHSRQGEITLPAIAELAI